MENTSLDKLAKEAESASRLSSGVGITTLVGTVATSFIPGIGPAIAAGIAGAGVFTTAYQMNKRNNFKRRIGEKKANLSDPI